jgi:hypothetical protein
MTGWLKFSRGYSMTDGDDAVHPQTIIRLNAVHKILYFNPDAVLSCHTLAIGLLNRT